MRVLKRSKGGPQRSALARKPLAAALFVAAAGFAGQVAHAIEIPTSNPDLKLRWDNTFKYSNAFRVKDQASYLTEVSNLDDGDRNFDKGLVSNRIDWFSEFDVTYRNIGARVSAAAWYDSVYNRSNDNDSPQSANATSVPNNRFTEKTRDLHGRSVKLMDAFLFGKTRFGDMPATLRIGQHSLVYGESLFFGANGIANAQQPIDLVKLLSVPSSQFKEVLLPVNQISGQLQITSNLSIGAYYQLDWRKTWIAGSGSFLSDNDFVGDGAERIVVGAPLVPGGGPAAFWRAPDIKASDSGQGGIQLRYRTEGSGIELGFYAVRYNDKTPQIYFKVGVPGISGFDAQTGQIGELVFAYPENIKAFGASISSTIGPVNVAAEASVRHNAPLVSDPVTWTPGVVADNDKHALYALGRTAHAQVSAIYVFETTRFWDGGSFVAEAAWNRTLSITRNPQALDANTTRDATALRFIFEPAYFQVLPGLDLSFPLGVGYNPSGRSSAVFKFNGGTEHGGDVSIGINGTWRQDWTAGINFVHYLGDGQPFLVPPNSATPVISFGQTLKDRDFISLNVKRTF